MQLCQSADFQCSTADVTIADQASYLGNTCAVHCGSSDVGIADQIVGNDIVEHIDIAGHQCLISAVPEQISAITTECIGCTCKLYGVFWSKTRCRCGCSGLERTVGEVDARTASSCVG